MALRFDDYPKLAEIIVKRKVDYETLDFLKDLADRFPRKELLELIPKVEEFIRIRRFLPPEEEERRLSEIILEIDKIRDIVHKALLEGVEKVAKRLEKITDPELVLYASVDKDDLRSDVVETYIEDNKDVIKGMIYLKWVEKNPEVVEELTGRSVEEFKGRAYDLTSDLTIKVDRSDPTKLRVEYHFKAGCGYPYGTGGIVAREPPPTLKEPTEEEVIQTVLKNFDKYIDIWTLIRLAVHKENIEMKYPEIAKEVNKRIHCEYNEEALGGIEEFPRKEERRLICEGDKEIIREIYRKISEEWREGVAKNIDKYKNCHPPVIAEHDDKARFAYTCISYIDETAHVDEILSRGEDIGLILNDVYTDLLLERMDEAIAEMGRLTGKKIEEELGFKCDADVIGFHHNGIAAVIDCKKTETYEIKTPEDEIKMKEAIRENVKKFLNILEDECSAGVLFDVQYRLGGEI